MVLERREELEVVENEQRVESVQHRFPNDNLQLHDAPTTLTAQPVTVSQLTTRTVQLAVTVSQACCTFAIPVIANIASGYRRKLTHRDTSRWTSRRVFNQEPRNSHVMKA